MGKRRYNAAKLHLIGLIEAQIARSDNASPPASTKLKKAYRDEAEDVVAGFEEVAEKRGYSRGVMQSFWGAWLYTASLGVLSLLLWSSRLDVRDMVKGYLASFGEAAAEKTKTPTPTPSPAPTPTYGHFS